MVGLIFCGGKNERIAHFSKGKPKVLLPLKENYTILDKQISQFRMASVNRVILLASERKHFKGYEVVEDVEQGTFAAFINALKKKNLSEDVVLRNGDIVADFNLRKMIDLHKRRKSSLTMLAAPFVSPYGVLDISGEKVVGFCEKPVLPYKINAGVYIFSRELIEKLKSEEVVAGNIEERLFERLAQEKMIDVYDEGEIFFKAVDTVKDYNEVLRAYEGREDKPWGYEKVLAYVEEGYLSKELFILSGFSTSYHYHEKKRETIRCVRGEVMIKFDSEEMMILSPERFVEIEPRRSHSIIALKNSTLLEFSTPHLKDVVRVEDYYGRV